MEVAGSGLGPPETGLRPVFALSGPRASHTLVLPGPDSAL